VTKDPPLRGFATLSPDWASQGPAHPQKEESNDCYSPDSQLRVSTEVRERIGPDPGTFIKICRVLMTRKTFVEKAGIYFFIQQILTWYIFVYQSQL
jgi:hypothetical protein